MVTASPKHSSKKTTASKVPAAASKPKSSSLPCSKHSVVVEFRPLPSYKGEFGFDWLRIREGMPLSPGTLNDPEEGVYIDSADGHYHGCIEGGAINDASATHDMTKKEAKKNIQKEYQRFQIERRSKNLILASLDRVQRGVKYRLLTYFVPYLNLFPEGTRPAWEGNRRLVNAKNLAQKSGRSQYCLHLSGAHPPAPPCEARLQVLIDVKDQAPHAVVLEYNAKYLEISGTRAFSGVSVGAGHPVPSTVSGKTGKVGRYALSGHYKLTPETHQESVKKFCEITIKCIKPIPENTEITAWAYDSQGNKAITVPVGKMIVRANDAAHQKKMKIALVRVATNVTQKPKKGKKGVFNAGTALGEVTSLYNTLYQALIIPDVINTIVMRNASVRDITLNLSKDPTFRVPTAADIAAGNNVGKYIDVISSAKPCINTYASGFAEHLERGLDKSYPALSASYCLAFGFGEDAAASPGANLMGLAASHVVGGYIVGVRSTVSMYPHRDAATLPHELLHTLQLYHTHNDNPTDPAYRLESAQKYIFTHGVTTNIMSYNFRASYSTWRWQWKIMWNNADKVVR